MKAALALLLFAVPALACLAATGMVRRVLLRNAVLDHPNSRSGHRVPTPRGGGIAVIGVVVAAWGALAAAGLGAGTAPVLAGALVLATISWFDDLAPIAPLWRLLVQAAVVAGTLWATTGERLYFGGLLPAGTDVVAAVCCGSGSSTCSTSWTAWTVSAAWRQAASAWAWPWWPGSPARARRWRPGA